MALKAMHLNTTCVGCAADSGIKPPFLAPGKQSQAISKAEGVKARITAGGCRAFGFADVNIGEGAPLQPSPGTLQLAVGHICSAARAHACAITTLVELL